jgi:hypothetical protein
MLRLIYVSEFNIDTAEAPLLVQLNAILDSANRHNERNGITGVLVFDRNWFVQLLEGEERAVRDTYRRLEADPRHRGIRFVEAVAVPGRLFGQWWMGCAERGPANEAIFAPFLLRGRFQPNTMSGAELLALLTALGQAGLRRTLPVAAMPAGP